MNIKCCFFISVIFLFAITTGCANESERPNVIIIMTDDQGYGDLGCHGNDLIKTPHLDQLYNKSTRLTNYHVSPTCAPTRAAMLTGHYANRTGVWHTIGGRSLLRENEVTLADVFKENGYSTAIFGKWHLGDNYPFRPQDRGFDEVLTHGAGGVGQTPDYFDNDYYDDTYFHNGKPEKYEGYCTDIWFKNALRYIEEKKANPFLCYIAPNAPHGPFYINENYAAQYRNNPNIPNPEFYGMITNIDDNIGLLISKLEELGIAENTIVIFTTDNGTAAGVSLNGKGSDGFVKNGHNNGMRGKKSSMYEGGHRVPFFIHWPKGGIKKGIDISELTAHVDLFPSLIELCRLKSEKNLDFDGTSLAKLLTGKKERLEKRHLITDSQRIEYPKKWRRSSVMQGDWRLINGEELYDLSVDPEQTTNIADNHPDKVIELKNAYKEWWSDISPSFENMPRIKIGSEKENPAVLTCHDWHAEGQVPWHHGWIRKGLINNGYWAINIQQKGRYKFTLSRWPKETSTLLIGALDPRTALEGTTVDESPAGVSLDIVEAGISINGIEKSMHTNENDTKAEFIMDLESGDTQLKTWFKLEDEQTLGAYYVEVERL